MGNFEKLSVLVIVVIIVMILVVAIYEWSGSPSEGPGPADQPIVKGEAQPPGLPTPAPWEPSPPVTPPANAKPLSQAGKAGVSAPQGSPPRGPDAEWWTDKNAPLIPEKDPLGPTPDPKAGEEGASGTAKPAEVKPTEVKPAATEFAETTHVVASGDTLGGIAKKYWGKASLYPRLEEANPGVTAQSLRVGTKLKVPAMKIEASKAPELAKADGADAKGESSSGERPVPGKEYKVRGSDTWERISKEAYKTSERWPDIYVRNMKLTPSPRDLRPGLVIMIPR